MTSDTKYAIKIHKKPSADATQVSIEVTRNGEHSHQQKTQIRRGDRDRVAEDCLLVANGSAKNYVDHLKGVGVQDPPSVDAIRKIVQEMMSKELVSTCWMTNLQFSVENFKVSSPGRYIHGFIQVLDVKPNN